MLICSIPFYKFHFTFFRFFGTKNNGWTYLPPASIVVACVSERRRGFAPTGSNVKMHAGWRFGKKHTKVRIRGCREIAASSIFFGLDAFRSLELDDILLTPPAQQAVNVLRVIKVQFNCAVFALFYLCNDFQMREICRIICMRLADAIAATSLSEPAALSLHFFFSPLT